MIFCLLDYRTVRRQINLARRVMEKQIIVFKETPTSNCGNRWKIFLLTENIRRGKK